MTCQIFWRKSSYSGTETNCVEVALGPVTVLVRDSKNVAGPVLGFASTRWGAFLASVKEEQHAG
ncbi:DUF397 domain-containing protein [Goodfellowiella coeruleoviolacea]|uniref:DUF397 domain-containing protein n=1 Tax=Goodfellowiella coeruleoviolacea TaxID=334858 RepID=A0AAE3KKE9_9PSEU|nr:DUF397 domain-containing protein [Goodfellowiella coeruleoviolacea]MCP2165353.1 protein of unknown function (DUF397) [Goodfellowiella coeruleoviolacea]